VTIVTVKATGSEEQTAKPISRYGKITNLRAEFKAIRLATNQVGGKF